MVIEVGFEPTFPEGTTLSTSRVFQFRHSTMLVGVVGFEPTLSTV